jgi:hypothetical protein
MDENISPQSKNIIPEIFVMDRSPLVVQPSAKKLKREEESPRSVTATTSRTASPTSQTISLASVASVAAEPINRPVLTLNIPPPENSIYGASAYGNNVDFFKEQETNLNNKIAENKGQKGVYINIAGDLRNARGVSQVAKIQRAELAREIADKKKFEHMENIGLTFGGRRRRPGHKTTRRRRRVVHSRKSRKPRKYMKSRKPRKSRKSRRVKR